MSDYPLPIDAVDFMETRRFVPDVRREPVDLGNTYEDDLGPLSHAIEIGAITREQILRAAPPVPGFLYQNRFFIKKEPDGTFSTVIEADEFRHSQLVRLEDLLHAWSMLQDAGDFDHDWCRDRFYDYRDTFDLPDFAGSMTRDSYFCKFNPEANQ